MPPAAASNGPSDMPPEAPKILKDPRFRAARKMIQSGRDGVLLVRTGAYCYAILGEPMVPFRFFLFRLCFYYKFTYHLILSCFAV